MSDNQAPPDRVPLPLWEVLPQLHLPAAPPDVAGVLDGVTVTSREVQGPRPLCETLEWQLSDLHWGTAGVLPFAENEVPYFINNSGRLSQSAAAVLFAHCQEAPPAGAVVVLEVGAGTGLFARCFLDAFRELCAAHGADFYERLRYHATDRSERSVAQWGERGLFAEHPGRVVCASCDALDPARLRALDGAELVLADVRAVFCNYVLDSLPATVLRRGAEVGVVEEMRARTNLVREEETVRQYTQLGLDEIRRLAESGDPAERARLLPLLTLLEPEVLFLPVDPAAIPYADEALQAAPEQPCVLVSAGALRCLDGCLGVLDPLGFALLNDYGPTRPEDIAGQTAPQRFGATMALGLNFPLIGAHFAARGCTVVSPSADERKLIHARLLLRAPMAGTAACFEDLFGEAGYERLEGPAEEARQHLLGGRLSEALASYRTALTRCPRDWWVAGEMAELVVSHLRDFAAGLELARAALALNPWYSAWLWNVLGDSLFSLGRFDEAHTIYLQAARIDPHDIRTNLNLSYSYTQKGLYRDALLCIARGLCRDVHGIYRARLLDKQQQLLSTLSTLLVGEQERLGRRADRLRYTKLFP